jgi:hypothetical protein
MPTIGQINKRYVSAIDPMLDIREIRQAITDIQNDTSFMSLLTSLDGKTIFKPQEDSIDSAIFHSWQNDALSDVITFTGATITGSGTASLSVTGLPVASQGKVIVGDLLQLQSNNVVRVMTVPLATSFTAVTVDGSNATLTASQVATIVGSAFESGSAGPSQRRWGLTKLSNVVQIMRDSIQTTDIEMQNGVEFEINGQKRILPYESIRLRDKHMLGMSASMFLGRLSTTRFSDASPTMAGSNGNGIQTTRGLDQYITQFGIADATGTTGTLALSDLEDVVTKLVANRSTYDYLIGCSTPVSIKFSNLLKNLPSSGAVNSARINVQGKEIDLDCTSFTYGGFKFAISNLGLLDNAQIMSSGGTLLPQAKAAYFMPLGKAKTVKNGFAPFMSYKYQAQPTGSSANRVVNGMTEEIRTDGQAPVPTSTTRVLTMTMTTTAGLEILNPQAFLRLDNILS